MITIIDRTSYRFSQRYLSLLKKDIKQILDRLSVKYRKSYGEVNIAMLSENEMQELNHKYLHKNHSTDVLSFGDNDNSLKSYKVTGDVALCPYKVLLYAFQDHHFPVSWFYHTLTHGLLHLYGLEHNYSPHSLKKIYSLQENILKEIKFNEESVYGIFEKIILFQKAS